MSKKNFKWWVALPATVATLPLIAASCVKAKIDTNPSPSPQPDPSKPDPMNPNPGIPNDPNKMGDNNGNSMDKAPEMPEKNQPNKDSMQMMPKPGENEDNTKGDDINKLPDNNSNESDNNAMGNESSDPQKIINDFSNKFAGLNEVKIEIDNLHNLFDFNDNSKTDVITDNYKWLIDDFELIKSNGNIQEIASKLTKHLSQNPDKIISEFSTRIKDLIDTLEDDIKTFFKPRYLTLKDVVIKSYKKQSEEYLKIEEKLLELQSRIPKLIFTKLSNKNSWIEFINLLNERISEITKNEKIINDFKSKTTFNYKGKLSDEEGFWFDINNAKYTTNMDYYVQVDEIRVIQKEAALVAYNIEDIATKYKFKLYIKYLFNNENSTKKGEYIDYSDFRSGINKDQYEENLKVKYRREKIDKFKKEAVFQYKGQLNDDIEGLFREDKIVFKGPFDGYNVNVANKKFEEGKSVVIRYQIEIKELNNNSFLFDFFVKFLHSNGSKNLQMGSQITSSEYNNRKYLDIKKYNYMEKLRLNNIQSNLTINYLGKFTDQDNFKKNIMTSFKYDKKGKYENYDIFPSGFRLNNQEKFLIVYFLLKGKKANESENIYLKFKYDSSNSNQLGKYVTFEDFNKLPLLK
ncbi:hypothetical protein [Mycoplasma phocoeninasale]|uniref:hypothetical protein n=1 Tax=Mycoplasma phocoeninasale TaxID=2726117 RepID=UPI0019683C79|nr:hypothetical protein [Mycoplasma phocoeninasale]MBN0970423.1 hypothetical protein [Mycoplasma phocoeninasale]